MSLYRPVAVKHTLTAGAGNNFNGTLPPGTPDRTYPGFINYPTHTAGGLFTIASAVFSFPEREMVDLIGVHFDFAGGQTSWSLTRVDVDGHDTVLFSGTSETSFVSKVSDRFVLLYNDVLKLTSSGAAGGNRATLFFEPHSPHRR